MPIVHPLPLMDYEAHQFEVHLSSSEVQINLKLLLSSKDVSVVYSPLLLRSLLPVVSHEVQEENLHIK